MHRLRWVAKHSLSWSCPLWGYQQSFGGPSNCHFTTPLVAALLRITLLGSELLILLTVTPCLLQFLALAGRGNRILIAIAKLTSMVLSRMPQCRREILSLSATCWLLKRQFSVIKWNLVSARWYQSTRLKCHSDIHSDMHKSPWNTIQSPRGRGTLWPSD